jgi:hypothetical protein
VFEVGPGESGEATAELTKLGGRLLGHDDALDTTATIESALPSGTSTTSTETVTLTRAPG